MSLIFSMPSFKPAFSLSSFTFIKRLLSSSSLFAIQFSHLVMSDSLGPLGLQQARPPCPSPTPEFTQTHVHWVDGAIPPSHPLSSPSPLAFNLSQHQGLFQWVSSSHQVAKVLESDIICVSEVVDISPGNLNSRLCFIQPSIFMMYSA